jgi:serine/threonine protein kinase
MTPQAPRWRSSTCAVSYWPIRGSQDDGRGGSGRAAGLAAGTGRGAPAGRGAPGLQAGERADQRGRGQQADRLRDRRAGRGQPDPAGTLVYAPPEQFGGSPATPASDVFAATATFYECLTGRPPFTGDTAERLLYQHLSQVVPLEPLRALVAAGLAKDPGDRPADGAALVAGLRTVAGRTYGPD